MLTNLKQNNKLRTGEMCKRGILIVHTADQSHINIKNKKKKVK